jgi:hypothetical protein
MNSEKEIFGEVYTGEAAQRAIEKAYAPQKKEKPLNEAQIFVEEKMIENEIVPEFDGKMTYGQLFRVYEESGETIPVARDEKRKYKKFKEWYLNSISQPPRKAA